MDTEPSKRGIAPGSQLLYTQETTLQSCCFVRLEKLGTRGDESQPCGLLMNGNLSGVNSHLRSIDIHSVSLVERSPGYRQALLPQIKLAAVSC